ncbi:hypothetical protein SNARM312S_02743 [Streptomyces narbonensis]
MTVQTRGAGSGHLGQVLRRRWSLREVFDEPPRLTCRARIVRASYDEEMTDATHGVTTGAVARRLGVSPTTLRSWDQRYGIGPAARVGGRHRRWSPADIAVLETMCRLTTSGVPPAEAARAALARAGHQPSPPRAPGATAPASAPGSGNGLPLGGVEREFRGLARAAVRLDSPTMDTLLRELVAEHGLVTSWEDVDAAPTLHAVGRKWESSNDRYVEVEHLLSWHISTTLRQLAGAARPHPAGTPPVLLACVPGEQHTLPLEALAAGLAALGLSFRMFGAAGTGRGAGRGGTTAGADGRRPVVAVPLHREPRARPARGGDRVRRQGRPDPPAGAARRPRLGGPARRTPECCAPPACAKRSTPSPSAARQPPPPWLDPTPQTGRPPPSNDAGGPERRLRRVDQTRTRSLHRAPGARHRWGGAPWWAFRWGGQSAAGSGCPASVRVSGVRLWHSR